MTAVRTDARAQEQLELMLGEALDRRFSGEGWLRLPIANGQVSDAYYALEARERWVGGITNHRASDARAQEQLDRLLASLDAAFCGTAHVRVVFYNGGVRASYRKMEGK